MTDRFVYGHAGARQAVYAGEKLQVWDLVKPISLKAAYREAQRMADEDGQSSITIFQVVPVGFVNPKKPKRANG